LLCTKIFRVVIVTFIILLRTSSSLGHNYACISLDLYSDDPHYFHSERILHLCRCDGNTDTCLKPNKVRVN